MFEYENLLRLDEPYFHLAFGTEANLCDFSWKILFQKQTITSVKMIRGDKCKTVDDLFDEFSAVFQFPHYFGENWDAFNECLNDLEWMRYDSYVLFISNINDLLAVDGEEEFKTFLSIIDDVANEWINGRNYDSFPTPPTPFHVVFHCATERQKEVCARLAVCGIKDIESIRL